MKIFWIGPYLPSPGTSGGDIRSYNLMKQLKRRGATLRGWFQGIHDDRTRKFFDDLTIKRLPAILRYFRAGWGRLGRNPLSYGRYYDPLIQEVIPEGYLPYVDHLHMSINVPDSERGFWLDEHNIEFVLWEEYAKSCSLLRKWFFDRESELVKHFEFDRIYESAGTGLPSPVNLDLLPEQCREKISIIPNGVSEEWIQAGRESLNRPIGEIKRFGFIGSYEWPPNHEAIDTFLSQCWKSYYESHTGDQFLVAGESPQPRWSKISGVKVLGFVDNSADFFDRIDVLLVPLEIGSGTRLKILEAAARGVPVISTEKGLEGLQLPEVVTVSDRSGLPDSMRTLKTDASLKQKRESNFSAVQDNYSWSKIGDKLWRNLDKIKN